MADAKLFKILRQIFHHSAVENPVLLELDAVLAHVPETLFHQDAFGLCKQQRHQIQAQEVPRDSAPAAKVIIKQFVFFSYPEKCEWRQEGRRIDIPQTRKCHFQLRRCQFALR